MSFKILDKASYSLVRTNPKLTTNVKLITNGSEIYLESFNANVPLSSSKFKSYRVDGLSTYDNDIYNFYNKGLFPVELAYEAFQEFKDTSVLSSYGNQYEMTYSCGARSITSESYKENIGILSPLWLNEQIPNYFVVFRVNEPSAFNANNVQLTDDIISQYQTSQNFSKFILENCTAIKTFDLTEASKIGSYIRRYRSKEGFPKSPITVNLRKDEPILWNGISYKNGGFSSSGNFSFESLISQDSTIIQNEHFFTQGFQRNGIILANLINLEFLFSDETAEDYTINRYFGLYVNEIEEGSFLLSGEDFYKSIEKTQIPKISSINEVSEFLNSPLELTNKNGILLHINKNSVSTATDLPTPHRVNELESIFYVKNKFNEFHTIKKGSHWESNQIRLFDKKIDISKLSGFSDPNTFTEGRIIKRKGKSTVWFTIYSQVPVGTAFTFLDGLTEIGKITANVELTNGPGTWYENLFNPTGTVEEIAKAINGAITNGINPDRRLFNSSINKSTIYIQSRFGGSRFNNLKLKLNWDEYPDLTNIIKTYPDTSINNTTVNFIGGNDIENSNIIIPNEDQIRFSVGKYVKSKIGFNKILSWVPYLEEPIFSESGEQIGYNNIEKYVIIATDNDRIILSKTNQIGLNTLFYPKFGRFSFFPIRDFDFDFYSEKYSNLGEIGYEILQYNQTDAEDLNTYIGISNWTDIRGFYNNGGFSNLIGLIRQGLGLDSNENLQIKSEYERLKENFIKEQAIASRIIPYINKWGWYNDGRDVRNNKYRLNVNPAFGVNNFAPSKWNVKRSPIGFSHEWYYLSKFPGYFTEDAIKSSWSYFDKSPVDNIEKDILLQTEFDPGTFQRIDFNFFDEYFIADRFIAYDDNVVLIDKQLRYGRFNGGDKENFAECFLRGVRIIAKPKSIFSERSNFNAKNLSYIKNGSFNDYRFSAILVPNEPNKQKVEVKFVKNDKWKTVVMLIFVSFENEILNPTSKNIDRTTLYSINSDVTVDELLNEVQGEYEDTLMRGSISLNSSFFDPAVNQFLIQGTSDIFGNPVKFLQDIKIGADGKYNSIVFEINGSIYLISEISRIISDDKLYASSLTLNGISITPPLPLPSSIKLKTATYFVKGGGFKGYELSLDEVGFSNIYNMVNQGNPLVKYETIDENGNRVTANDGLPAQTFSIELRAQDDLLKSTYLGVLPDLNKPTIFNLIDIIGYELSLQSVPQINSISRHAGWYEPISDDIVFFRDPYANINFEESISIEDFEYKEKVFNLCRHANTQFYSLGNNFGLLKNYFYHKINEENSTNVLELSNDGAFLSLYPLINEIGISYKNYYTFSSNWDPGYFTKTIDKTRTENIIGTKSMVEKKSFFGSKYLKLPEQITLETFTASNFIIDAIKDPILISGNYMYVEYDQYIEFYVFIKKKLTEYFSEKIRDNFTKYINPNFSFGNISTLEDDIQSYIENNILTQYKLKEFDLYVKNSRENLPTTFSTSELDNFEKTSAGLIIDKNISIKTINTNMLDLKIIYNKKSGFSESYGFSVTVVKK